MVFNYIYNFIAIKMNRIGIVILNWNGKKLLEQLEGLYGSKFESKEVGFGLGAGMNYFVSSNFSIEAGVAVLGYSSNDNGGDGADKTNTFSFGGDWRAVTFGVNYKF